MVNYLRLIKTHSYPIDQHQNDQIILTIHLNLCDFINICKLILHTLILILQAEQIFNMSNHLEMRIRNHFLLIQAFQITLT